jgi:hypothetical protein
MGFDLFFSKSLRVIVMSVLEAHSSEEYVAPAYHSNPAIRLVAYLCDAQNIVGIPDLGNDSLCDNNKVDHARHERPSQNNENRPLNLPLLPLLRLAQRRYDVAMLCFVIGRDARRKRIVIGASTEKTVCQGKGDQAGDGQDEEREELALNSRETSRLASSSQGPDSSNPPCQGELQEVAKTVRQSEEVGKRQTYLFVVRVVRAAHCDGLEELSRLKETANTRKCMANDANWSD